MEIGNGCKNCQKFPAWNKKDGFCWLCSCVLQDMRVLDAASAPWRLQRRTGEQFLSRLRLQGVQICEIFTLPGVSPDIVFPDWMHTADLVVTQDVMAHVFHDVLPRLEGGSVHERTQTLFQLILKYYDVFQVKNRLDRLQYRNFTADGMAKANKLKCKAAVARDLVLFSRYCVSDFSPPGIHAIRRSDVLRKAWPNVILTRDSLGLNLPAQVGNLLTPTPLLKLMSARRTLRLHIGGSNRS